MVIKLEQKISIKYLACFALMLKKVTIYIKKGKRFLTNFMKKQYQVTFVVMLQPDHFSQKK